MTVEKKRTRGQLTAKILCVDGNLHRPSQEETRCKVHRLQKVRALQSRSAADQSSLVNDLNFSVSWLQGNGATAQHHRLKPVA